MAKNSPVKKTPVKIPKWATCLIVVAVIFAVLVTAFWVLLFLGFSRYALELKKAGFSFNPNQKSFSIRNQKTGEGITVGEQNSVPKALEKFPVYSNARMVLKVESDKNPSVTLSTSDNSKTILAWYKKELAKAGWAVEQEGSFLVNVKNKEYSGTVAFIQLDNGTTITITLNKSKK